MSAVQPTNPPADQAASDYAVVLLRDPPAASYRGTIPGLARTAPERGLLNRATPAYRAYQRHLDSEHAKVRGYLARQLPQVEVVDEYHDVLNGVAVKLNGADPASLGNGPGVRAVAPSALYRPSMNRSVDLVRATEVWGQLGGAPNAGAGIRVAVIDSGIDLSNPFFADAGLPAQPQTNECGDQDGDPATPDTNNKVVVCKVFAAGVAGPGPALVIDHGTHVAGTIGGRADTSGTVAGTDVTLDDLSGVAPGVTLGNYNVFPGFGAGFVGRDGSAFSHDIARALEEAVADGMHVANMSLGGTVQGPHDLLAEASNAAVDAGMVVVASTGNSGPGDATVGAPGIADRVIGVGASTNPHFLGVPVTEAGSDPVGGAVGDFDPFTTPITAEYTVTEPADGCSAISTDVAGKIALIDRGVCSFTVKIRNAQAAGAVGVIVANNVAGDPAAMPHDGIGEIPTIPAVMVAREDGAALKPSGTVTVDGSAPAEFVTDNADIIAGFSSRGPTPFTTQIKPDLTAPGVNVASSVFGGEFAFFNGTSMAAPHVTGAAALLLDRYPGASPAEVKSRLVNNAARVVTDHITGTVDPGVLARGGGRLDVVSSFDATSWFDPVSVSFGLVRANRPFSESRTIAVGGAGASAVEVDFAAEAPAGMSITAALDGDTITVDATVDRSVPNGDYQGDVVVTGSDGGTYLVPFFVRVTGR